MNCRPQGHMDMCRRTIPAGKRIPFPQGTPKRTALFFLCLMAVSIVCTALFEEISGDDCFMMANWRAFLKSGFYQTDPLSLHHTFRCSLEKWLSCAIVYHVYQNFGLFGMRVLLFLFAAAISAMQYRLCAYTSGNKDLSLLFAAIMTITTGPFLQFRPQTVTTLLLLLETLCLEHWVREGRARWLIFLPILSLLEMQLHSTIWPCFFMVLAPYVADAQLVDRKITFHWKKKIPLLVTAGACFGSLFCNPYGAWSVFYIFRSYGDADMNGSIVELAKPDLTNAAWAVWLLIVVLAFVYGNRRMPLRYHLLCLGFVAFSATAVRNEIFLVSLAGFVPCYLFREKKLRIRWNLLPVIPILVLALCIGTVRADSKDKNDETGNQKSELQTLSEVFAEMENYGAREGMNIFCDFNSGSFAEYFGYHPYIDGRAEVFLKRVNGRKDVFAEFRKLKSGRLYYRDFLDTYDMDFLVVDPDITPAFYQELCHAEEVELLFEKNGYTVFRERS